MRHTLITENFKTLLPPPLSSSKKKKFFIKLIVQSLKKKEFKKPKLQEAENVSSLKSNKISFRKQARIMKEKSRRENEVCGIKDRSKKKGC